MRALKHATNIFICFETCQGLTWWKTCHEGLICLKKFTIVKHVEKGLHALKYVKQGLYVLKHVKKDLNMHWNMPKNM
jgi:Leu/Phe-tRNA-protein transferase